MKNNMRRFLIIFITLLAQGCFDNKGVKYCPNVQPVVDPDTLFFDGVSHAINKVSESNNQLAISCHNCYQNLSDNPIDTLDIIGSAVINNVDLIELDIVMSDDDGFIPYISHEAESKGPLLTNVISQPILINASQILFLEIKGKLTSKENVRKFFYSLMKYKLANGDFAYLNSSRFTVIRSIETDKTLRQFREVLSENEFENIKPFVKLSRLFYPKSEAKMINEIEQVYSCGFHMIELDTRIGITEIQSLNSYAELLGVAVNVFTIDESNYEEVVPALKNEVDVITVEPRTSNSENFAELTLFERIRQLIDF